MNKLISPLQRQAIIEGAKRHYTFRPVHELDYKEGWVYERVPKAPEIAAERIKVLETSNLRVCEIYVFHEAPKVLPAPKVEPVRQAQKSDFKISNPSIPSPAPNLILEILGVIAMMFIQVILLDPACVVKLEDGSFVEVVRWLH